MQFWGGSSALRWWLVGRNVFCIGRSRKAKEPNTDNIFSSNAVNTTQNCRLKIAISFVSITIHRFVWANKRKTENFLHGMKVKFSQPFQVLRTVALIGRYFFSFVPMWDLLLVPKTVKIQKENGGGYPALFRDN